SATGSQPRRDTDEAEHRLRQNQHHHHPARSNGAGGRQPRDSSHPEEAQRVEDENVAVPSVARPASRNTRARDGGHQHHGHDSDEDDEDVQEADLGENGVSATLLTSVSSRGRIRRINPKVDDVVYDIGDVMLFSTSPPGATLEELEFILVERSLLLTITAQTTHLALVYGRQQYVDNTGRPVLYDRSIELIFHHQHTFPIDVHPEVVEFVIGRILIHDIAQIDQLLIIYVYRHGRRGAAATVTVARFVDQIVPTGIDLYALLIIQHKDSHLGCERTVGGQQKTVPHPIFIPDVVR
uniref:Uncharacterized protein n=1 Tax=Anopheles maculatus TaxID=74869 RepID=A0A182SMJ6_9DIPT